MDGGSSEVDSGKWLVEAARRTVVDGWRKQESRRQTDGGKWELYADGG